MTPRAAALARLLEDWEGGRLTPGGTISQSVQASLAWGTLMQVKYNPYRLVLTPAGLAAARAEKEKG